MSTNQWRKYERAQDALVCKATTALGVVEYDNLIVNPLVKPTGNVWRLGTLSRKDK